MKTAEQLYYDTFEGLNIEDNEHLIPEIMIKFAQMHVEAALKSAVENADLTYESYASSQEGSNMEIDANTILKSYPLENIK